MELRRRRPSGESTGSASDAELDLDGDIAATENPKKPKEAPVPEQLISQIGAVLFALTLEIADPPRVRRHSRDGIGLLTSAITPGARRRELSSASRPTVMVGRMAQYLNAQALLIGVAYLARFLDVMLKSDSGGVPNMTADQILIWYVTAAVLADKFTNVTLLCTLCTLLCTTLLTLLCTLCTLLCTLYTLLILLCALCTLLCTLS